MMDRTTVRWGWFVAFMIVSNSTTLIPFSWGIAYYAVLLVTIIYLLVKGDKHADRTMLLLYVFAALSILVNDIPPYFKVWPRLGTFILLTSIVSPFVMSRRSVAFRTQLFTGMTLLLVLVTVISIVMLGFGGGYGRRWFQGATTHSMLMGPVASVSNLYCLFQLQYPQRKKWGKYVLYAMIGGGFLCVLQSGSRTALIGSVVSFLSFLYFRNKSSFGRLVKKYMGLGIIVLALSPLWVKYMDKIQEKNKGTTTSLNTDSREEYWMQRIAEWKSSPILGIGFSAVDAAAEGSNFSKETGNVETGSSWLCALSMTGVAGFGCVLGIFVGAFRRAWKMTCYSPATGSFLLSVMVFFIFHMMAEGYIFAGGNFLNTQVWLLMGTIFSITKYPEYADTFEEKLQLHW